MGTIVHSGKELRDYVFTVGLVLTSMHYARRWSLAVINSMPIIPQASGKQYKPRSRESHNQKKQRRTMSHAPLKSLQFTEIRIFLSFKNFCTSGTFIFVKKASCANSLSPSLDLMQLVN